MTPPAPADREVPAGGLSEGGSLDQALASALHDEIDGDFLVGASRWAIGEHRAMGEASVTEIVWWAVRAVLPVVEARLAAVRAPDAGVCSECSHATHGDSECGEVVGYDHLNGDHECGCPGPDAGLRARVEALADQIDATADETLSGWRGHELVEAEVGGLRRASKIVRAALAAEDAE